MSDTRQEAALLARADDALRAVLAPEHSTSRTIPRISQEGIAGSDTAATTRPPSGARTAPNATHAANSSARHAR